MSILIKLQLILCLILFTCKKEEKIEPVEPIATERLAELQDLVINLKSEAIELYNSDYGNWLTGDDCDAYLWQAKYQAEVCDDSIDMRFTEYKEEKGRFGRNPYKRCWTKQDGDVGSKSTWSQDMGKGLNLYAWRCKDADIIKDHFDFVKGNNYQSGEPLLIGTTVYSVGMMGEVARTLKKLTGENNREADWNQLYSPGLTDYEAHLQMLGILLTIEQENKIDASLLRRIEEHAARENQNPLYQAMLAIFNGDFNSAIDACINGGYGDYVRGRHRERYILIDRIFACGLVLKRLQ